MTASAQDGRRVTTGFASGSAVLLTSGFSPTWLTWLWGYESMSTGLVRQLWMKLRRFVLSARWSDAGQETR